MCWIPLIKSFQNVFFVAIAQHQLNKGYFLSSNLHKHLITQFTQNIHTFSNKGHRVTNNQDGAPKQSDIVPYINFSCINFDVARFRLFVVFDCAIAIQLHVYIYNYVNDSQPNKRRKESHYVWPLILNAFRCNCIHI